MRRSPLFSGSQTGGPLRTGRPGHPPHGPHGSEVVAELRGREDGAPHAAALGQRGAPVVSHGAWAGPEDGAIGHGRHRLSLVSSRERHEDGEKNHGV